MLPNDAGPFDNERDGHRIEGVGRVNKPALAGPKPNARDEFEGTGRVEEIEIIGYQQNGN